MVSRPPSPAVLLTVALLLLAGCGAGVDTADSTAPTPAGATTAVTASAAAETSHPAVAPDATATVVRVVDGDTVVVAFDNGTRETVRLLGVDTPEVRGQTDPGEYEGVPDTEAGRACLRERGDAASAYVSRVAGDATVRLGYDPESPRRGFYGRVLAYVYVRDGGEWRQLNYQLLARGDARLYESDFVERDRYAAAERRARTAGRGLWACALPGVTPGDGTDDGPNAGTTAASAARGSLTVARIRADADGDDNRNLNDEYVVLRNDGDSTLRLDGWTVSDEAGKTYAFPSGTTLSPGESLTLYTGRGDTRHPDYYWGRDGAVWNNDGDVVTVRRPDGRTVAVRRY